MKRKIDFVFLILHYLSYDETLNCVNSIKEKCKNNNIYIIIVDNNSNNNSGKELEKKFINDNNIKIILNKENFGFANGNNIGFKYIKENIICRFLIMLNNDTVILQNNFCNILLEEYSKNNFDVMGPKIILPNNKYELFRHKLISKNKLKFAILKYKIYLKLNKIYLYIFPRIIEKAFQKIVYYINIHKLNKRVENSNLQGSFLIFTKRYINKFNTILDPRTFLYYEEDFLYYRVRQNKMLAIYNPQIEIFHNEHSSTNNSIKKRRIRRDFIYNNLLKSSKILLEDLEKEQ